MKSSSSRKTVFLFIHRLVCHQKRGQDLVQKNGAEIFFLRVRNLPDTDEVMLLPKFYKQQQWHQT